MSLEEGSLSEALGRLRNELDATRISLGELSSSFKLLNDDVSERDSLELVLTELQSVNRSIERWKQTHIKASPSNSRPTSPSSRQSLRASSPSPIFRPGTSPSRASPLGRSSYQSPRMPPVFPEHRSSGSISIPPMTVVKARCLSSSDSSDSSDESDSDDGLRAPLAVTPHSQSADLDSTPYEDDEEDVTSSIQASLLTFQLQRFVGDPSPMTAAPFSSVTSYEDEIDQAVASRAAAKLASGLSNHHRESAHPPPITPPLRLSPVRSRSNTAAASPPVFRKADPGTKLASSTGGGGDQRLFLRKESSVLSADTNLKSRLTRLLSRKHHVSVKSESKSFITKKDSPLQIRPRGHKRSKSVDNPANDWQMGSLFEVAFGLAAESQPQQLKDDANSLRNSSSSPKKPSPPIILTTSEPHPRSFLSTLTALTEPDPSPPSTEPNDSRCSQFFSGNNLYNIPNNHIHNNSSTTTMTTTATTPATSSAEEFRFSSPNRAPPQPALILNLSSLDRTPVRFSTSGSIDPRLLRNEGDQSTRTPHVRVHSRGHPINWNARFQNLLDSLQTLDPRSEQRLPVYLDLSRLAKDFAATAIRYGVIIIDELNLPHEHKTIPPTPHVGGIAGGVKYIYHGIFFKFASKIGYDASNATSLYPTEEAAQKAAGHEMKANTRFFSAVLNQGLNIRLPLFILIDYKGWRLSAQSILPISKGTLRYGSADGGHTTVAHPEFHKLMTSACAELNICSHLGGTAGSHARLFGPTDIEGHTSPADNRNYLIDLARVFPPTQSLHVGERTWLYEHFRPEFVRKYPRPLCSDAFSKFLKVDPEKEKYEEEILQASVELLVATKAFASRIDQLAKENIDILRSNFKHLIHREGINFRYIGWLRRFCHHPEAKRFILVEMFIRTLRKLLFADLRTKLSAPSPNLILSQEASVEVIIEWFNVILTEHVRGSHQVIQTPSSVICKASASGSTEQSDTPTDPQELVHSVFSQDADFDRQDLELLDLNTDRARPRRRDRFRNRLSELHRKPASASLHHVNERPKSRSKSPGRMRTIFNDIFALRLPGSISHQSLVVSTEAPCPAASSSSRKFDAGDSPDSNPSSPRGGSTNAGPVPPSPQSPILGNPIPTSPRSPMPGSPIPQIPRSSSIISGVGPPPSLRSRSSGLPPSPRQFPEVGPSTEPPPSSPMPSIPQTSSRDVQATQLRTASASLKRRDSGRDLNIRPTFSIPSSPAIIPSLAPPEGSTLHASPSPRGTLWPNLPAFDVASTYWNQICNLLPKKYSTGGVAASPEEFNEFSTLAQRIDFLKTEVQAYGFSRLFKQLCDLSGIRLRSVALRTLENPLLVRKMYFTRADIEELHPRVKVMAVMDVVEAEALWIELANRDPEEADRLFSVVMDRFENAINSTPDQISLSLRYAAVLIEQAQKTNKHHRRIDLYKVAVRVYSDSGLWEQLASLARDILEWYSKIESWSAATSKNQASTNELHNLVSSCYESLITKYPKSGYWAAWGDYLMLRSPEEAGEKYQRAFENDLTFLPAIREWAPAYSGSTLASIVQLYRRNECFMWVTTDECAFISDHTLEAIAQHCAGQVKYVVLKSLPNVTDSGLGFLAMMGETIIHLELMDLQATSSHGWFNLFQFLPNLRTVSLSLRLSQHITTSIEVSYARALTKLARCSPKLDRVIFFDCPGVSVSLHEFASLKHLSCLEIIECSNVGQALIPFCELSPPSLTTLVVQQSFGFESSLPNVSPLLPLLPTSLTSLYLCENCAINSVDVKVFLGRCRFLEKLVFYKCQSIPFSVFKTIAHHAHHLTRLKIGDIVDMSKEVIIRLLSQREKRRKGLKRLQELELLCAPRLRTSGLAFDYSAIEAIRMMCPSLLTLYISGVRLSSPQNQIEQQLETKFPGFTLKLSESFY